MNYSLSRRYFIQSSTALALSQLLGGCARGSSVSQILFLENSIPPQLIREFRRSLDQANKVAFKPQTHIPQIFDYLINLKQNKKSDRTLKSFLDQILNRPKLIPSLVTLGDVWLSQAIANNLIQPLSTEAWNNWQNLPQHWQNLVRRNANGNLADDGEVYGAPYRWGCTIIAYRSDKLESAKITIEDWQDLWQEKLSDRLSLLDSPREVIGLTLKKLGRSYNTSNLDTITELEQELLALHQQAKLYSSDRYLEPLILGDTWAAVAWSTDILPLQQRYPEIKIAIPQSGTSVWADIWVKPQLSEEEAALEPEDQISIGDRWIDYCWQPQTATKLSQFTNGLSPALASLKWQDLPPKLQANTFLNSAVLNSDRCEFLLPLQPATEQQYSEMWLKIRQSNLSNK